jgi:hypothetical protein
MKNIIKKSEPHILRKAVILPLSIFLGLSFMPSGTHATTATFQKTIRILYIGNSMMYEFNMPKKIQTILQSLGYTVNYKQETPGGWYLRQHAKKESPARIKIKQGFHGEPWDYVIANGNTMEPATDFEKMLEAVKTLKKEIAKYNPNAKLILHSTNPYSPNLVFANSDGFYKDTNLMSNDVDSKYARIAKNLGIQYGPNTKGIQKLYQDGIKGTSEIWAQDGKHHSNFSHSMAAYIYAAMISGVDPTCFTETLGLSQTDADYAKSVAKDVIIHSNQGIILINHLAH